MRYVTGTKEEMLAEILKDTRKNNDGLAEIEQTVAQILADVKQNGDVALQKYSEKFDGVVLDDFQVTTNEIDQAYHRVERDVILALEKAKENILSFHQHQQQTGFTDESQEGVIRGQLVLPLEKVGLYVPGGTAAYPSSVLMNALPAKIAGVSEIIMITPPNVPDVILAAAKIAEVSKIFRVGGAQGIAALAYGTQTLPKVDKIVGPGNIFVATAKKQVYGEVAIDMIAGPSEIGVIADETANPRFIAADLLSQAEHDKLARALLVTNAKKLAEEVEREIEKQLETLPRKDIASVAIREQGRILLCEKFDDLFEIMNALAPEHLEIQVKNPLETLKKIKHAGSVFLGNYASEPVGDYFSGTNHVLPTNGTSRFYSPLGVYDFVKHTAFTYYTKEALARDGQYITTLARKEGLEGHARAIEVRFEDDN